MRGVLLDSVNLRVGCSPHGILSGMGRCSEGVCLSFILQMSLNILRI